MAFFSSALSGLEGRHFFVEGDGTLEDIVPGPRDADHQGGRHDAIVLTGEAGGVGASEEPRHGGCPAFLLDLDQGLDRAGDGRCTAVAHPLEGEVGGVIVMDDDALEFLVEMAAPGGDAQGGQQWGAQHVEPSGPGVEERMPVSSRA